MRAPLRVVFDCSVYFQALIGRRGPAARCVECATVRKVFLCCSEATIEELLDVSSRDHLRARFRYTDEDVRSLIASIRLSAEFFESVPERYLLAADASDSHYVNLALETGARLVVSRDRDLLRLMDVGRPEGREFRSLFPNLEIVDPPGMLRLVQEMND